MGFTKNRTILASAAAAFVLLGGSAFSQEADIAKTRVEKGSLAAPVTAGSLGSGKPAAGSASAGKPQAGSLTIGKPQAGSLSSGKPAAGSMASGVVGGSLAPVIPGPPPRAVSPRRAAMQVADDGSSRTRKPRERRTKRY